MTDIPGSAETPALEQAGAPPPPEQTPPPEATGAPASAKPGQLPLIYSAAAQARTAGYSWDEINDRLGAARTAATGAGYSDAEVDQAFGLSPSASKEAPPPGLEQVHARPDVADNIRAFSQKYLTPFSERGTNPDGSQAAPPPIHSAVDLARQFGWDLVDMGKVFGGAVVNGAAAIVEGLDGKPRSLADQVRLGIEAQGFLGLLAGASPGRAVRPGVAAAPHEALPALKDTLDAATAVAKEHPEGVTPDTLTGAARALGQNFVDTGEHPLTAAQRAADDAGVMAQLHARMDALPRQEDPEAFAQRDTLVAEQDGLRAQIAEHTNPTQQSFDNLDLHETTTRAALENANPRSPDAARLRAQLNDIQDTRQTFRERQRVYGTSEYAEPPEVAPVRAQLLETTRAIEALGPRIKEARDAVARKTFVSAEGATPANIRPGFLHEAPDELLDAAGVARESAAAVQHPGLIPDALDGFAAASMTDRTGATAMLRDASPRPALEPVPANDALDPLTRMGTPGQTTDANMGIPLRFDMPQMDINPETIGQPNPVLADGLATSFRRVFNIQSLDREGAGVIRHHLADTQANRIRSTENLRRFGRAVNDLSSADRRTWWHAYEVGSLEPYKGTALESMGEALRGEFDRKWDTMNRLDIAPNYVENYLPRLYQNPTGASAVFGRRPLAGSRVFTRARAYEYLSDAEAAGQKLVTDNPAEAALIRLHDMDRYINAHQIMKELEERGLGRRIIQGQRVEAGLARINDKIATGEGGTFYAPDAIATMLNRHLSPGLSGEPIYDTLRSATSMVSTLKLMLSAFHPLYLSWSAQASAFGLGLKQIARGGVGNIVQGAAQVLKFPIAPLEDIIQGKRVIDYAKTGVGTPQIATMYDAMIASGARFGRTDIYNSSAAGSFWNSIKGSILPHTGLTTFPQEIAAMLRNAPPVMIGRFQVAPGYLRAVAQMVPRVMDTLSDPIMGKLVPMMKTGALSRMLQEEMAAHPGMGLEDMRRIGGRFSDTIDNRIGELVQDNIFWPTALHNINNVAFMAPQWFMGKLRLMTGAGADLLHGGFVEGAAGTKELSDNLTYLIGGVAATVFASAVYGYLKGTWTKDWTLRDYMAPPTAGLDAQNGDERIMLPSMWRDVYGWEQDPARELLNKVTPLLSMVGELVTNRTYSGAAITDPATTWAQSGGDYATFVAKELEPLAWSQTPTEESQIDTLTRLLGGREAPFGIREPDLDARYKAEDTRKAVKKKARQDARSEN